LLFRQLVDDVDARGNDVADAYLAAFALENNATWLALIVASRGFTECAGATRSVDQVATPLEA
jgi:hypothetical protein